MQPDRAGVRGHNRARIPGRAGAARVRGARHPRRRTARRRAGRVGNLALREPPVLACRPGAPAGVVGALGPVARRLGPRLALAAAAGWLVARSWTPLGLPAQGTAGDAPFPGLWAGVFAVGLTASFVAFTLLHEGLRHAAPPGADADARRAAWWDGVSYALLPLFPVAMFAGQATGTWRWLLPVTLVAIVAGKTALAVTAIYRALVLAGPTTPEAADPPALGRYLVAAALLPAALLAPYVAVAVSTGGDEPGYLLNVESLRADGDLDVRNNVAQGDAASFYWGPPPAEPWSRSFPGFAALLLPGYAFGRAVLPGYPLAGRLG